MSETKDDKSFDLQDNGIYLFSEDVTDESCAEAIQFILEKNLDTSGTHKHLTMIINSPGGNVIDGFALIDIMAGSRIPVHTVGLGIIASMGLQLFIAGKKGERVLTPNTLIMSHQWSGFFYGKEHELVSAQKEQKLLSDMIMRHYRKHTKLSEKKIREVLLPAHDVWLTAKEALALNICDKIKDI
jgi:ATP-dependent Clp protease protease subunit